MNIARKRLAWLDRVEFEDHRQLGIVPGGQEVGVYYAFNAAFHPLPAQLTTDGPQALIKSYVAPLNVLSTFPSARSHGAGGLKQPSI